MRVSSAIRRPVPPRATLRVLPFMILGGVMQMGLSIGMSAADSLFIAHVGANRLPLIYAVTPVMMLIYIGAYTRLLRRYGIDTVFRITLGLLVGGGVLLAFALGAGEEPATGLLYAAKLYTSLWYIGIYTLLWNFVDGFFNLSEAKRDFGFIAGGAAIGAIFGGILVSESSARVEVSWLFLGWAGTAVLAWPVLAWIRSRVPRVPVEMEVKAAAAEPGMKRTLGLLGQSRYVKVLTLLLFMTLVTATLCEFSYMTIFEERMRRAEDLVALFGKLYAAVNVLNLVITLVLFQRLVRWGGVRNLVLVQPAVFLGVFVLLLTDGGMVAALAGFVAFQGIMTSLDYNNVNLLFNALPEEGKKETRTVIEGICEPLAMATAGLFLWWGHDALSAGNLALVGVVLALACLVLGFILRADYVGAVAANLRRAWLEFTDGPAPTVTAGLMPARRALGNNLETWREGLQPTASPVVRARALDDLEQAGSAAAWLSHDLLDLFGTSRTPRERGRVMRLLVGLNDSGLIRPCLARAGAITPAERRQLAALVAQMGAKAIPAVVQTLRDVRQPLAARVIAARALVRLSPSQLQAMLPELIDHMVERMWRFRAHAARLRQVADSRPGHEVLRLVYEDLPHLSVELLLELLAVAGRLPGYDAIMTALSGTSGKEKGFALESIEQACGQRHFRRLLPFLGPGPGAHAPPGGASADIMALIEEARLSAYPLEAAAGLSAAVERDPTGVWQWSRESCGAHAKPLVRETTRVLLERGQHGANDELTVVERIHRLAKQPFFRAWRIRALERIAAAVREVQYESGEIVVPCGAPALALGLVWAGELTPPGRPATEEVVGRESLGEAGVYQADRRARSVVHITWIDAAVIRDCIVAEPRLGVELLRWKLEAEK